MTTDTNQACKVKRNSLNKSDIDVKLEPMSKNTTDLRDRKLEGDIHALLMDFRDACLDARSELHQTGEVDTTTNKIIVAQARADDAIKALISNREKLARLERGIYELERLHHIPQMFGDWENVIDDRIATLRKELDGEEPTNE